ncbi:hypothetical protein [Jiella avicenniae]|uniref:Uncharacterized protein n=1 Tax=Jiella avicenniae TaxID=2907202 RepID=A0A9X1P7T3_9HYPH|nr:hypothetical protein [Jiella avicenniae]MCE7030741.1 hypothetical protein [Jiella avicenniae]
MGEIGRITKTVGVDDLPEDIREKFVAGTPVSVTFEGELAESEGVATRPSVPPEELEQRLAALRKIWGAGADLGTTTEEAVQRIRALRDEWDD